MRAVILCCKPGSQFHLGKVGLDENTALSESSSWIHSDTLFSAIINIVAGAFPDAADAVVKSFDEGKIRISSAFFCLRDPKKTVYFLPKPAHYQFHYTNNDAKQHQHIRFISKGVWEQGILPKEWPAKLATNELVLLQNAFLATREELSVAMLTAKRHIRFYDWQMRPRVAVNKETQENSYFYLANLQIADNSGFLDKDDHPILSDLRVHYYFLLETETGFEQATTFRIIQTALQLLSDIGIGGERSVGAGNFTGIEGLDQPIPFEVNLASDFYATLSLFAPASEQELSQTVYYDTLLRGGRPTRDQGQLRYVRMIAEGALTKAKVSGQTPDISPNLDRKFLRYGKPISIPVKRK